MVPGVLVLVCVTPFCAIVCLVGKLRDSFCARLVNCSFGASGEDKREEVFIIWEEKQRDPFTAIMLQEVECWAPPVGPSQLLDCNWIPLLLSSRLPALFEVISSAGKKWKSD